MNFTFLVEAVGVHAGHYKKFATNVSPKLINKHLNAFLDGLVSDDPSIESAKEHVARVFRQSLFSEETKARGEIYITFPNQEEFRDTYAKLGLVMKNTGWASKGQFSKIPGYYANIINLWLYRAAVDNIINSLDAWPPIEIQPTSKLIHCGGLTGLDDLAILGIMGCSILCMDIAVQSNFFKNKKYNEVVELIKLGFSKRGVGVKTKYHANFHYVLREYVISKYWSNGILEVNDIYTTLKSLTIEGRNSQYNVGQLLEILTSCHLVKHLGKNLSLVDYLSMKNLGEFADKELQTKIKKDLMLSKTGKQQGETHFKLGATFETISHGVITCKDVIGDNVYFTKKVDYEYTNYRPDKLIKGNEISEFNHQTFTELFSYQRDFLSTRFKNLSPQTLKGVKRALSILNKYLCDYLYPFAQMNAYKYYDCSGSNFINSRLAIIFNESEILARDFEETLEYKIRPVKFKAWLDAENVFDGKSGHLHKFLRNVMDFFKYCHQVSPQGKYANPIPEDYSKQSSHSYKETSKEIFGLNEWFVWNELIRKSFAAVIDLFKDNCSQNNRKITTTDIFESISKNCEIDIIKNLYQIEIRLNQTMLENAHIKYCEQYDGIWLERVDPCDLKFASSLAAIFIINSCGLRSNGAVNLPYENLVLDKIDNYYRINVPVDKVYDKGIKTLILEENLDLLQNFRVAAKTLFPKSFRKQRFVIKPNRVKQEFEGFFGINSALDEDSVSRVCDFFFYLFNELCDSLHQSVSSTVLSRIPIPISPRQFYRGTSNDYKDNHYSADALVGSLRELETIDLEEIDKHVHPVTIVVAKPDRTPHGLRASFDTNYFLAGLSAEAIGQFTGQNPRTVMHYVKATPDNLLLMKQQGVFGLMQQLLSGEVRPYTNSSIEEVQDKIKAGVLSSGAHICSPITENSFGNIDKIYREGSQHVAIHPTHLCPYNDQCPPSIKRVLNHKKNCAVCPVSVSFITDIPAINQKIRFHIEEAQTAKKREQSATNSQQKKALEGMWHTHFIEASQWLARFNLMHSNAEVVSGNKILTEGKNALLEFSYQDDKVLSELLSMIESKDFIAYQSEELKNRARFMQLKMNQNFDDIDPNLIFIDPVETVCRTMEKMINLHKLELKDVLDRLKTNFDNTNYIGMNTLLLGGNHG